MGALLGAELGIWVSEPGELERLARSLGVARHGEAVTPPPTAAVTPTTAAQAGENVWHVAVEASPKAGIPSVDVSVLPRAGEGSHAAADTPRTSRPTRVTRRARARAAAPTDSPRMDDAPAPLDPSTLSTALSDALGE
jgi:hypothetical protein